MAAVELAIRPITAAIRNVSTTQEHVKVTINVKTMPDVQAMRDAKITAPVAAQMKVASNQHAL